MVFEYLELPIDSTTTAIVVEKLQDEWCSIINANHTFCSRFNT